MAARSVILAVAALACTWVLPSRGAPTTPQPTALVIGAGVAGLKAAADLADAGHAVTVLEARNRTGGRVWTVAAADGGPIELGAQWIHGSNNPIMDLARDQGWKIVPSSFGSDEAYEALSPTSAKEISEAEDDQWDGLFDDLTEYVAKVQTRGSANNAATLASAVASFAAARRLTPRQLRGLDERVDATWTQEYGASPSKLSLNYFDNERALRGGDSILVDGYSQVVKLLSDRLAARGGRVILNAPVTRVDYAPGTGVTVTAGGKTYAAPFAVVTLPVGVLKAGSVTFAPPLTSDKAAALAGLGMGTLNKVILSFRPAARWPDVNWIARMPLAADAGRWREFFSLRKATARPVMVAFNAGDAALYPTSLTDGALVSQAVAALRGMFGAGSIPLPEQTWVTRWHEDPLSVGAYSVVAPGAAGNERRQLAAPTGRALYWAGEATSGQWPATVPGAWQSGADAAAAALKDNPPRAGASAAQASAAGGRRRLARAAAVVAAAAAARLAGVA